MTARMRAADAERHEAAALLGQHVGSGRLTTHEYDERVQRVYAATYVDELDEMFEGLPARTNPAEVVTSDGPFKSAFSAAAATSGPLTGKIRAAVTLPHIRQAYQHSPIRTILALILGLVVLGAAVALAVYVAVPVLMIMLVVHLVRRRRRRRQS